MEEIKIGGIYQHFNGDYYFVKDLACENNTGQVIVVYNKCDKNGVFKSIRVLAGDREIFQHQPFYRFISEFMDKFKFIKMKRGYEINSH